MRRLVNAVLASIRLVRSGYVDESLSVIRTAAECLNLLQLFSADPAQLERWITSNGSSRRQNFSPVKVRLYLENSDSRPDYPESAYAALCSPYVHAVPIHEQGPHSLQRHSKLYAGPIHPMPGLACVFTEAGYCVAKGLHRVDGLLCLPETFREESERVGPALLQLVGDGQMKTECYPDSVERFLTSQNQKTSSPANDP